MQIRVKTATGREESITVCETDTSDAVRQKVAEVLLGGIAPSQVQLYFGDRPIPAGQLQDIGVQHGALLMVVISEKHHIEVTVLYGKKRITLTVEPTETIEDLKTMLCEKVGLSIYEQRLLFQRKEVTVGNLKHHKVCHGAMLELTIHCMQIFLKDLEGKTHTIDAQTNYLVERLKDLVFDCTRVPQLQQRLLFGKKQLEDGETLSYYGIERHSTIHLVGRLRGG